MTTIDTDCEYCGAILRVAAEHLGKNGRCPVCQRSTRIQARTAAGAIATPPPIRPVPPASHQTGYPQRLPKGGIICPNPNCGYRGIPEKIPRGSILVAAALMFLFIIPGLLYAVITAGHRFVCPQCGIELKTGRDRRIF